MNLRMVSEEVVYAADPMPSVGLQDVPFLKERAARNPRRRMRICTHRDEGDALHEMLIALHQDVYVRPHRHVGKVESAHVIEGSADLVVFDPEGSIEAVLPLGDPRSGRRFYYRMAEPRYHTLVLRSEFLVFHEVTNGPFRREDMTFAPWSPPDGEHEAIARFRARLDLALRRTLGTLPPDVPGDGRGARP